MQYVEFLGPLILKFSLRPAALLLLIYSRESLPFLLLYVPWKKVYKPDTVLKQKP